MSVIDTTMEIQFVDMESAFEQSFPLILINEIGDKSFLVAAIMAMKHSRLQVFFGTWLALTAMTVLSALFGYATSFIPKDVINGVAAGLFAIFGIKLLYDGLKMAEVEKFVENRLESVPKKFETGVMKIEGKSLSESTNEILTLEVTNVSTASINILRIFRKCVQTLLAGTFFQAFIMTFLAEWGDRSQITTILLAASENIIGVTVGCILAHGVTTCVAVLGGHWLSKWLDVKKVTIIGGIAFIGCAIWSVYSDFIQPYLILREKESINENNRQPPIEFTVVVTPVSAELNEYVKAIS